MMNMTNVIRGAGLAALFLSTVSVSDVRADGKQDLYFQQAKQRYFNQPENARTFGMAGSSIPTSTDSSSVVGNPAGLGMMQRGDVSATYGHDIISGNENKTYSDVEQKEDMGQVMLASPLGPYADALPEFGTLGLGWSGSDGNVDRDPFNAESEGQRITLAYGKALSDTLSIGYSLGYVNDEYQNDLYKFDMDNGFRNTFGVLSKLDTDVTLGASAFWGFGSHDISGDTVSGESDSDEYGVSVGAGYQMGKTLLTGAIDYEYYDTDGDIDSADPAIVFGGDEEGNVMNARVGLEHEVTDWFKARAGYYYGGNLDYESDRVEVDGDGSAKYNAWSLGAGANLPIGKEYYVEALNVDYGVQYREVNDGDWQHVVTVSAPFSPCD